MLFLPGTLSGGAESLCSERFVAEEAGKAAPLKENSSSPGRSRPARTAAVDPAITPAGAGRPVGVTMVQELEPVSEPSHPSCPRTKIIQVLTT